MTVLTYRQTYYQRNKGIIKARSKKRAKHQYWIKKAKLDAIKVKNGCARCSNKDPRVLTFHHLDPSKKSDTISNLMRRSWTKIEAEVAKCEVLCFNCHNIVEWELRQ